MGGLTKGYVFQRVLMWLLTIWIGVTLTFAIPRLGQGDPTSAMVLRMMNLQLESGEYHRCAGTSMGLDGQLPRTPRPQATGKLEKYGLSGKR